MFRILNAEFLEYMTAGKGLKMTWMFRWVVLILVASLCGCDFGYSESAIVGGDSAKTVAYSRPAINAPAPPFRLSDLDGDVHSLPEYQGKVVFLNFWATWCGPCKVEMPAMEALYQAFRSQGLEILAVSVDQQGAAVTRPFKEAMGLSFPILHDSDYQVGLAYGARTLPMTYVIDRQGIIRQRVFGARDWDSPEARNLMSELLEEPYQAPSEKM
jgi:peroxiredoxin